MSSASLIEVERKFKLESASDIAARVQAAGGTPLASQRFDDAYWDTADCVLTRRDVWLRTRTHEEAAATWELKVPATASKHAHGGERTAYTEHVGEPAVVRALTDLLPPDRAPALPLADWLRDDTAAAPDRAQLADAVRLTARTLAALAPGAAVEVRIPPFVAVQCIEGPRHTRGNPPNVVETDPRTWLRLATGLLTVSDAGDAGRLTLSGSRATEIAASLPLVRLPG